MPWKWLSGGKDYFRIEEQLDDGDWLSRLGQLSPAELPLPKPKKKAGENKTLRETKEEG